MIVTERQEQEFLKEFENLQIIFGKLTMRQKVLLIRSSIAILIGLLFLATYSIFQAIIAK